MLVLTRCKGETLLIGDDIKITTLMVGKNKIKLAIQAPSQAKIKRAEYVLNEHLSINKKQKCRSKCDKCLHTHFTNTELNTSNDEKS